MRYAAGLARGSACACIPLIGSPSDHSGGATITLALDGLRVEVTAEPAMGIELIADESRLEVLRGAIRQILAGRDDLADAGMRLEIVEARIPPDVGLGEGSATVLAALEALNGLFGVGLAHEQMPPMALACLTDQLGQATTLRDPVAQSEGGLTFMDFDQDGEGGGRYEPLDPALLPPLFIAWRTEPVATSERAENSPNVEKRDTLGRLSTLGAEELAQLGGLAQRALSPLLVRDGAGFGVLMERDRELRETTEPANPLAEAAAKLGVAVNSTSPTGAITGLFRDEAQLDQIREALAEFDAELLVIRHD